MPSLWTARPQQGFVVWPNEDGAPKLVGWFGGIEQEYLDLGGTRQVNVPPFARRTYFATGPNPSLGIAIADNERYRIEIYSTSGELSGVIERPYEPIRIESEWIDRWKEEQRANVDPPSALPQLERAWKQMTLPSTLPPLEGIAIDATGLLWVLAPAPPGSASERYEVMDVTGRTMAWIEVPAGLVHGAGLPPWISKDRFVGWWRDELGVESVRVYKLTRGGPPPRAPTGHMP